MLMLRKQFGLSLIRGHSGPGRSFHIMIPAKLKHKKCLKSTKVLSEVRFFSGMVLSAVVFVYDLSLRGQVKIFGSS